MKLGDKTRWFNDFSHSFLLRLLVMCLAFYKFGGHHKKLEQVPTLSFLSSPSFCEVTRFFGKQAKPLPHRGAQKSMGEATVMGVQSVRLQHHSRKTRYKI